MPDGVLITGATGFVGQRLSRSLVEEGLRVVALSRDPARAKASMPELNDAFEWHGDDRPPPPASVAVRAVVHLAGETVAGRWTAKKRRAVEQSRVEGTRAIVDAIGAAPFRPNVLISASAVGYYGDPGSDREITEEHAPGKDFLSQVCIGWEREAMRARELGVRVVCMRIGLVLGKEGGPLGGMLPAFKVGLGGRMGSGTQFWPWVHIEDVVRFAQTAIDDERYSGVYNLVAPEAVTQAQFAKTLASILKRPAFLPAPAFALKALLGSFSDELLVSRNVVPRRAIDAGFEFRFPKLEPALRDLLSP